MVVCHCMGLSDREIRRTAHEGARSTGQLMRRCGAGTVCGGCRPTLQRILQQERSRVSSEVPQPSGGR